MRKTIALTALALALPLAASAATPYQVTGTVLEVKPNEIVVQKNAEKWSVATNDATAFAAKPEVGQTVTVSYTMTARKVDLRKTAAGAVVETNPPSNIVTETGKAAGEVVEKTGNVLGNTINAAGEAVSGAGHAVGRTTEKIVDPPAKQP